MGTSKSVEPQGVYVGGVSVFSGRPDPTWTVAPESARRLEALWDASEKYAGARPSAPVLGYRGCFLREGDEREWFAYGGVVTLRQKGASESRRDEGRTFEKTLLSSAPEGVVPSPLLDAELRA
jgi:hypothetical protein